MKHEPNREWAATGAWHLSLPGTYRYQVQTARMALGNGLLRFSVNASGEDLMNVRTIGQADGIF